MRAPCSAVDPRNREGLWENAVSTTCMVTVTGFCPMKKDYFRQNKLEMQKTNHGLREWLEYRIVERSLTKIKGDVDWQEIRGHESRSTSWVCTKVSPLSLNFLIQSVSYCQQVILIPSSFSLILSNFYFL